MKGRPGKYRTNSGAKTAGPGGHQHCRQILAVSFAAVPHGENANSLAVQFETHAVVADPKAILGRVDVLDLFYAAGASFGEPLDTCLTRRASLYRVSPYPPARPRSTRPVSLQPQAAHGFIVRDAFAAALGEPVAGFTDGLSGDSRTTVVARASAGSRGLQPTARRRPEVPPRHAEASLSVRHAVRVVVGKIPGRKP